MEGGEVGDGNVTGTKVERNRHSGGRCPAGIFIA